MYIASLRQSNESSLLKPGVLLRRSKPGTKKSDFTMPFYGKYFESTTATFKIKYYNCYAMKDYLPLIRTQTVCFF